jgi:hypothetical protein
MKEELKQREQRNLRAFLINSREKTINIGVEKMVNEAIEAGDFNDKFSKEFNVKIINHLFINYTEIFPMEENFEMPKYIDNINNFIDFLKYGLGNLKVQNH